MTAPVDIVPASPDDFAGIAAIYGHYVETSAASFELFAPSKEEMLGRWQKIIELNLPYFVAKVEGEVAGYAYASQYRPRPAYRFTAEESVYVHPDFHGRGVARSLFERIESECVGRGIRQLIAVITKHDKNDNSVSFHERMGFQKVGELQNVGFKFGKWHNTIFMQKAIGEGANSDPV